MTTKSESIRQLENVLTRETNKLQRQKDAVAATEAMIALIQSQIDALRK